MFFILPIRVTRSSRRWMLMLLCLAAAAGCKTTSAEPASPATPPPQRVGGILTETLDKAQLHTEWPRIQVPMGHALVLKDLFYKDGQLYAITDQNALVAYNGVTGKLLWSVNFAKPGVQFQPFGFWRDRILVAAGDNYLEIRRGDGQIMKRLSLEAAATTGPARNEELVFLGCSNNRFYAYQEKGLYDWQAIDTSMPIGPVAVHQNHVFYCRTNGKMYANWISDRDPIWVKATNGKAAGVCVENGACFLPSSDSALYCFDPNTGAQKWKYLTGGELQDLPALTPSMIYQSIAHRSLLCLSRPDGKFRWELSRGRCLLAENGPVSYAMTHDKEFVVLDNVSGQPRMSFFVPDMDMFAVNTEDAMIYMATKYGTIIALKPNVVNPRPPAPAAVTAEPAAPVPNGGTVPAAPAETPAETAPAPAAPEATPTTPETPSPMESASETAPAQ